MMRGFATDSARRYSLREDGAKFLTRNFKVSEFRSRDGADTILIHPALVRGLQLMRDYLGKPITINSGYRTGAHNARVGGAINSMHLHGLAADIVVAGELPEKIAALAWRSVGFGGVAAYSSLGFTHVDVGARRTWGDAFGDWSFAGSGRLALLEAGAAAWGAYYTIAPGLPAGLAAASAAYLMQE